MHTTTRAVTVAATQMACGPDPAANLSNAERLVRTAAARGANIILIQELFETPYFCQDERADLFALATTLEANPAVRRFRELAAELNVVLPCSFFERANAAHYNSVAMIDAGGALLGRYRKSHIPDGPGYEEKYYFNPGDTGFPVWQTRFGAVGLAVCWDQWFPEVARILALRGAEMILYPTAIGSEPQDRTIDSKDHWQRTMQGHAAANLVPVVASNRIGEESGDQHTLRFYGHSFIADETGGIVAEADGATESILTATFDFEALRAKRAAWGLFRDRRPDMYGPIMTLDGETYR